MVLEILKENINLFFLCFKLDFFVSNCMVDKLYFIILVVRCFFLEFNIRMFYFVI